MLYAIRHHGSVLGAGGGLVGGRPGHDGRLRVVGVRSHQRSARSCHLRHLRDAATYQVYCEGL